MQPRLTALFLAVCWTSVQIAAGHKPRATGVLAPINPTHYGPPLPLPLPKGHGPPVSCRHDEDPQFIDSFVFNITANKTTSVLRQWCAPRGKNGTDCPTDVPPGATTSGGTVKPFVSDPGKMNCYLSCTRNSDCGGGAVCETKSMGNGACTWIVNGSLSRAGISIARRTAIAIARHTVPPPVPSSIDCRITNTSDDVSHVLVTNHANESVKVQGFSADFKHKKDCLDIFPDGHSVNVTVDDSVGFLEFAYKDMTGDDNELYPNVTKSGHGIWPSTYDIPKNK